MFDECDIQTSLFDDVATVSASASEKQPQLHHEFKPSATSDIMLGDVDGLIPDFSPWSSNLSSESYAMESTPSNCSTVSTSSSTSCFSMLGHNQYNNLHSNGISGESQPHQSQQQHSQDPSMVSPPLSASTSSGTDEFNLGHANTWSMDSAMTEPHHHQLMSQHQPMHHQHHNHHPHTHQRSVSMAAIETMHPEFHDPYTTALTPPSDTEITTSLATLSPASTFYCESGPQAAMNGATPTPAPIFDFSSAAFQAMSTFNNASPSPAGRPNRQQQQYQRQQQYQLPGSDPLSLDDGSSSSPESNAFAPAVVPQAYTKWVKLTPMSPDRVERIKELAAKKNIEMETVESVLTMYSQTAKVDNEVNKFCGDDVYIKITMGGSSFVNNDEGETKVQRRRKSDGSLITTTKKKHRKQRPNYVKRPLNSFMLYRKSQTQSAMAYALSSKLKLNHQNISQIIGLMWQTESKDLKDEFAKFASQEKELHKQMHPNYKFCPQKKPKKSV